MTNWSKAGKIRSGLSGTNAHRFGCAKETAKSQARNYPALQRKFLTSYIDKMVEMDFTLLNPHATWQAAPLCMPRPKSKFFFRLAIDLRPVNAATVKKAWPMPHLDSEMADFRGHNCFASLDFCLGYWQFTSRFL